MPKAKTIYLVFGSPATPETEDEVIRWYEPHLEQMASLPGIVSAQLYRPSRVQMPRLTIDLPRTLGLYEYDTDDLRRAVDALWASHLDGVRTGTYVPGRAIPPPADGTFALDQGYESAYYDLVSQWPRDGESRGTARTILLVFGSPTSPEMEEEVIRWYELHLEQMASLPGIVSAQFYRPSRVQLPRLVGTLPQTLGLYEYDTDDLDAAVAATWASHLEGVRTGVFEPGRAIPPPRVGTLAWEDVFTLDPEYQSAYYDLASEWPQNREPQPVHSGLARSPR